MFSLVYVSAAVKPFSQPQLQELLTQCRVRNTRRDVTGLLLYKNGNFMQALEGEEEAVRGVHRKIASDMRHRGMLVLIQEHQRTRDFGEWSMGFRDLTCADCNTTPGYSEFMNVELMDDYFFSDPSNAQKLLLSFRRTMT